VKSQGLEKKCKACDLSFLPNLSPAIMVLLKRENEILLARSPHFRQGMYSALAGFIDLGETAECAVHREVQEEVGLKVKSLQYFGSQSWPFPNSFMIAFTAEYLSGEIIMEPNEIEDAKWFNIHNIPDLPSMPSISRRLIDSVLLDLNE
jgi:NAD+ diphosphatase